MIDVSQGGIVVSASPPAGAPTATPVSVIGFGEQIKYAYATPLGSYSPSAQQCHIEGNPYSDYGFPGSSNSKNSNKLTAPIPLPSNYCKTGKFFWASGGTFAVGSGLQLSRSSAGNIIEQANASSGTTYFVQAPQNPKLTAVLKPVQVGLYTPSSGATWLSLGTQLNVAAGSSGITTTMSGTAPNVKFTGYVGGYMGVSQVISIASPSISSSALPLVDECPLYTEWVSGTSYSDVGYNLYVAAGASANATPIADAPGFLLDSPSLSPLTGSETFVDYLLWRPTGTGNFWVPLGTQTWTWGGTAVYNTGSWQPVMNPTSSAVWAVSTAFPTWNGVSMAPPSADPCQVVPSS